MTPEMAIKIVREQLEKDGDADAIEALDLLLSWRVSEETIKKIAKVAITPVPPDRPKLSWEREDESNSAD